MVPDVHTFRRYDEEVTLRRELVELHMDCRAAFPKSFDHKHPK